MKILTFILLTAATLLYSQQGWSQSQHYLVLRGKSYGDSIALRWDPSSARAWDESMKNGFIIKRYTLVRDGVLIKNPRPVQVNPLPLLPWPMERWVPLLQKHEQAGFAAAAIYGTSLMPVATPDEQDASALSDQAELSEARLGLALLSVHLSRETATASALRFTDTQIKKGERYLYKVYANTRQPVVDTAYLFVDPAEITELSPVRIRNLTQEKSQVLITWDMTYSKNQYTAYIIERSDDGGKTYYALSEPFLTSNTEEHADEGVYTDSLPSLGKRYVYRVVGVDAFAETGPPSDTVSIMASSWLTATPQIQETMVINNQQVFLRWDFPREDEAQVSTFVVERSEQYNGPYTAIMQASDVTTRTCTDTTALTDAYYRIKAIGKNLEVRTSPATLIQLLDSIPPLAPTDIRGMIDTVGLVTLQWKPNAEADILGYRIYRANFADDEFIQVNYEPVKRPVFVDTVNVKTLTRSLFYKIVAVDYHFNPSGFSEPLSITRPDLIPPVSPAFIQCKASTDGILLRWTPSPSQDVRETVVFRRLKGDASWRAVFTETREDTTHAFLDRQTEVGKTYEYKVVARDEAGLESQDAKVLSFKKIDNGIRPGVEELVAEVDRRKKQIRLTWKVNSAPVVKYIIYRQEMDGAVLSYATIDGKEALFTDRRMKINTRYRYGVKVVYADGGESATSSMIVVNY